MAVWVNGFVAYYKIFGGQNGVFTAQLIKYEGSPDSEPPREFLLHKEGRHWTDDDTSQDLLNDLGKAIEIQMYGIEQVSNPRNYNHGRPRW